jgi:hypothetical protein
MAKIEQIACDVCKRVRSSANHWWMAYWGKGTLEFFAWKDESIADTQHLCGHECAHKMLDEFMQKQA